MQNTLLVTKSISASQEKTLQEAGFLVVSYDAIQIKYLDFELPSSLKNIIFTSQNAVKSFLKKTSFHELGAVTCFCVGEKTKAFIEENGQKVMKMTEYASELADFIVKNHKNETFHFFCGNIRSDVLPSELKEAKTPLFEIKTYKTTLNSRHFDQKWDGILFFSPSGVRSFMEGFKKASMNMQSLQTTIAFCIGTTTASEAKKYNFNSMIAATTTVESVIEKTIDTFTIRNNSDKKSTN